MKGILENGRLLFCIILVIKILFVKLTFEKVLTQGYPEKKSTKHREHQTKGLRGNAHVMPGEEQGVWLE